ncbi:hypothetical protein M427DRAFT_59274 [Gonapodya prolifera JEL478]|uniref:C2H2-type domain-containing protein n=1 Tax=Gonapodya prolifera (strain JEL478) TaxID=1344416 RepID=A0A139A7I1_GONPJ|nr:hypothetical protein M427DRAFT_59274 [Gonapodya prolifera JEL478]|eukprot:KXS12752.1 hypothetical protein M427DRAFT_59274 [Gonapodya prolifera JEL478]
MIQGENPNHGSTVTMELHQPAVHEPSMPLDPSLGLDVGYSDRATEGENTSPSDEWSDQSQLPSISNLGLIPGPPFELPGPVYCAIESMWGASDLGDTGGTRAPYRHDSGIAYERNPTELPPHVAPLVGGPSPWSDLPGPGKGFDAWGQYEHDDRFGSKLGLSSQLPTDPVGSSETSSLPAQNVGMPRQNSADYHALRAPHQISGELNGQTDHGRAYGRISSAAFVASAVHATLSNGAGEDLYFQCHDQTPGGQSEYARDRRVPGAFDASTYIHGGQPYSSLPVPHMVPRTDIQRPTFETPSLLPYAHGGNWTAPSFPPLASAPTYDEAAQASHYNLPAPPAKHWTYPNEARYTYITADSPQSPYHFTNHNYGTQIEYSTPDGTTVTRSDLRGYANRNSRGSTLNRDRVDWRHVCDVSWCGRRFPTPAHLTRHLRMHTGDKPYVCSFCGLRFTREKDNMKVHELLHNGKPVRWSPI